MNKKYNVITFIIIFILILFSILIVYKFNKKDNKNYEEEFNYLKNYQDNEYMPIYINDESMAKIYFNDYKFYLINNIDEAYDLLNPNYRDKRFPSINAFKEYVNNLDLNITIDSYEKKELNDKIVFYLYSENKLIIIFSTEGVMQYEVYFDENTVAIE